MHMFAGFTVRGIRPAVAGVAAAATAGGIAVVALTSSATVTAAPDPCAASEVAKTAGSVATSTGAYLESHPQTNTALTMISQQQGGPQSLAAVKSYFDANPLVAADLQRLQQPLVALGGRCKLPVTLPQIMGLVQAAQQQAPAALAGVPAAQAIGTPSPASAPPADPSAVSSR